MAPIIRTRILQALGDLSHSDLDKFRFQLRNRIDSPRILRGDVEGKGPVELTDLLVSRFRDPGARAVALETLRLIDCNQEAETLESKTKACVDKGDPIFRKTSKEQLDTPSQEAENYAAQGCPSKATQARGAPVRMKRPEEVEADAKAHVLSEGGDPGNDRLVLSRYEIQFGKYKGRNFRWLFENDLNYAAIMVADHQKEREESQSQNSHMANKDSLTKYGIAYPEVLEEVRYHHAYRRAKENSLQPGREGMAMVGFGLHRTETLQDLYESKDKTKISYVKWLRRQKSACVSGSRMEDAIKYILQRDQERLAAAAPRSRPLTSSDPYRSGGKRPRGGSNSPVVSVNLPFV